MKQIAIITGASTGLGKQYTEALIQQNDADEYWLIARRGNLMEQIKQAHPSIHMRILSLDLTKEESLHEIKELLAIEQPTIHTLINNAGMGKLANVKDIQLMDGQRMIDLNCKALTLLTQIALPYMVKGSRILEVCSVASFQPMPGFSIYGATKAYVQSYTKAIHYELLSSGIYVTAVCPYWIKDTSFIPTAQSTDHKQYRHVPFATRSDKVVKRSLRALQLNLWICTPDFISTIDRFFTKFIPDWLMVRIIDLFRHF